MKKRTIKIIEILFLAMMIIMQISTVVMAADPFSPKDITASDPASSGNIATFTGKIVGGIRMVGVAISVIMIMVLGVKYMMGSAEEKSEYKKSLMPYVVGAVLIFGGTLIAGVIYDAISGLTSKPT